MGPTQPPPTPTTIVIPCYNEANRLPAEQFLRFIESQPEIGFVFVNDGSNDDTGGLLHAIAERSPDSAEVIELGHNSGKAEAVRQGLLRALVRDPEVVGFWDADLATPLALIPQLRQILDRKPELLMVFGSRVKLLGKTIDRHPLRHYAGRVFATAVSRTLDLPIYDSQCGAKLFRNRSPVPELFAEPFGSRWIADVEILARLRRIVGPAQWKRAGEIIFEQPLDCWIDSGGSKVRPWDFVRSLKDLLMIRRRYRPL